MYKIGNDGDVDKSNYKVWPLFTVFREQKKIKKVFKEIFDEEYTLIETPKRPVQKLVDDEIKKDKELKKIITKKVESSKEKKEKLAKSAC